MDPVSTFQLVAAIIGVVDFGRRLVSNTREILDTGQTAYNANVSKLPGELSTLSEQLREHLQAVPSSATRTASQEILLGLSQRCIKASKKLQQATDALQNKDGDSIPGNTVRSFLTALKSTWATGKIKALRADLTEIRSQMTIAMLIHFREDQDRDHSEVKDKLDEISRWLQGESYSHAESFREGIQVTLPESAARPPALQTRAQLVDILWNIDWTSWSQGRNVRLVQQAHEPQIPVSVKILGELSLKQVGNREDAISRAHPDTYKWIFRNPEPGDELKWPSFPEWLQETDGSIYWITGKPGSGKSTLMKFVFRNARLHSYLRGYSQGMPLLTAGFFFWNSGSKMQKSQEGLLRTLLYQCLSAREDLIPVVAPRHWAFYNIADIGTVAPKWTLQDLKESFEALCSLHGRKFRLALFIDGLDESEDTPRILLDWIEAIVTRHQIKCCVSSRPWNVFKDSFDKYRSLAMENLTKQDISRFVRENFDNCRAFKGVKLLYPDDTELLVDDIINKAQGVFLWVNIIVTILLDTMTDRIKLSLLRDLLADLPSDIEGLYNSIWDSLPREYLADTSKVFQLCRAQDTDTTAMAFYLAFQGHYDRAKVRLSKKVLKISYELVTRLLNANTRGICELASNRVELLHSTALDWMTSPEKWNEICAKAPVDFEPQLELLEAALVLAPTGKLLRAPRRKDVFNFVRSCFSRIHRIQFPDRINEERMVQTLDNVNRLACDAVVAGCKSGNISHQLATSFATTDSGRHEEFSVAGWPSLVLGENMTRLEFSFVGTAASAGFVRYVKAKVAVGEGSLLVAKKGRVSLLESAIFPDLCTVWNSAGSDADYLPNQEETEEQRLEIIKFLVTKAKAYDMQYETAFGAPMYDAVCKAQRGALRGKLDCPEWYAQVLHELEIGGYNASQTESEGGGENGTEGESEVGDENGTDGESEVHYDPRKEPENTESEEEDGSVGWDDTGGWDKSQKGADSESEGEEDTSVKEDEPGGWEESRTRAEGESEEEYETRDGEQSENEHNQGVETPRLKIKYKLWKKILRRLGKAAGEG